MSEGNAGRRGSERDAGPSEKTQLSPEEIQKRIREGNSRRKNMKKGVARRLLGNIKQWVGAVCLVSAVYSVSAVGCLATSGKRRKKSAFAVLRLEQCFAHLFD